MSGNNNEISRRQLVDRLFDDPVKSWSTKLRNLTSYLIQSTGCPSNKEVLLKNNVSLFFNKVKSRFAAANRNKNRFLENNSAWLNGTEFFPLFIKRGRPSVEDFNESSTKTKKRRTEHLRNIATPSELSFAACSQYNKIGETSKGKLINAVANASSENLKHFRAFITQPKKQPLSPEKALSLVIDAQLSVHQYNIIREVDKWTYPGYKKVLAAKKQCYPVESAFNVNEISVSVNLQELLDHTVTRLIQSIEHVLVTEDNISNLKLYIKWGIDGTSGFTQYKQKFVDPSSSDASMLVTCFVPIQLTGDCMRLKQFEFWKNPAPSSPRFCRPIRLNYIQETAEVSVQEMQRVQDEINNLKTARVSIGDKWVDVSFEMLFTMIDGKICNAITETSSTLRCYICNKTSSQFNCIAAMRNAPIQEQNLCFGLSVLHAWIRMFECLLHISYKLPVARWRAKPEDKAIIEERKKCIQQAFKTKLGLIVDRPKQGFGSSNDGNTARRFFENYEVSSEITGVNKTLIYRFHVILSTLSCGHAINVKLFETYCLKTAIVFIKLYPWYHMPTSLHKILIHAPIIISKALLPIGQLSEEALEARNKDIKRFRESYSRKFSRESNIRDVFNRLLITSDPFISSLRKIPLKKLKTLLPETISMLVPVQIPTSNCANTSSESINSSTDR